MAKADDFDENGSGGQTDMVPQKATDVFCCLILAVFMAGMCYCSYYGVTNGNLKRLNHGYDWQGHLCGVDDSVQDAPFLYYCGDPGQPNLAGIPSGLNLKSPICVSACPDDLDTTMTCKDPSSVSENLVGGDDENNHLDTLATHETIITEKVMEQKSYPSKPLMGKFCVPDVGLIGDLADVDAMDIYDSLVGGSGPIGSWPAKLLEEFGSLKRVWPLLTGSAVAAVVLGYAYLIFLRVCAKPLVYLILGSCIAFFFILGAYLLGGYVLTGDALTAWEEHNPWYSEHFSLEDAELYSFISGAVMIVVGLILSCVLFCSYRAIATAMGCIQAAVSCLFDLPSLLIQPLCETIAKVIITLVCLWQLLYLVTAGDMEVGKTFNVGGDEVGGLRRSFDYTDQQKGMIAYYIFGIFWLLEIVNAIGQFAVSYAVVCWYYTPGYPKKNVPAFLTGKGACYAMTFHLGSMAMGSFLIAVCRFIRLICSVLAAEAKSEGNKVMQCIYSCLERCVKCIEECIGFINKNAYINIAIVSNNFCMAAREAFNFMLRETVAISVLNGVCWVFALAGMLLIGGGIGLGSYFLITTQSRWTAEDSPQHVASPLFVAAIIAVMSGFIAQAFMVVFDHTADTLLFTFCWNKENGHNSVARYAPPALQAVTGYQKKVKDTPKPKEKPGFWSSFFGSSKKEENTPLVSKGHDAGHDAGHGHGGGHGHH